MHFLPVFPVKELSPRSSSSVHCSRRIAGDITVPIKVYKTTSGMEDVNFPPFHERKIMTLAGGMSHGNKRRSSSMRHSRNPCHRTQWTKELVELPKSNRHLKKTCPDLLSINVSAAVEQATHRNETGKGDWKVLGCAFPLPYTPPLILATGQWWRQ